MVRTVEVINFLHELDLLEAHLDEHQHFIDKIVVVESGRTYSGMPKNLFFNENKERFRKYNVTHEILPFELHTPIPSSYGEEDRKKWFDVRRNNRERQQAYIFEQYKGDGDYICNADADEIWSRHYWHQSIVSCMEEGYIWIAPNVKFFAGYLDAVCPGMTGHWRIARSDAPGHVRQKHTKRGESKGFSGWHFSSCYKDPVDVWYKGVGIAQSMGYLGWATVPKPIECAELLEQDIDPISKKKIHSGVVMPLDTLSYLPDFMDKHSELYPWLPEHLREGMQLSDWSPHLPIKVKSIMHIIRKTLEGRVHYKVGRWVTEKEAETLCRLIKDHNVTEVYESGTANGYSACRMTEAGVRVTTFDPFSRPHIWDEPEFKSYGDSITYVEAGFETMKHEPAPGPRLFFIDGEHDITHCRLDLNTVLKGIKKGDVIAFHDYRERKVAKVINRMNKDGYKGWVERTEREIFVMVKETDAPDDEVI